MYQISGTGGQVVHNFPIVPVFTHSSGLCPVSLNAYSPCEDAELALNQGGRIVSDKTQIVLCPDLEADCSPGTDLGIGDLVVIETHQCWGLSIAGRYVRHA